MPPDCARKRNLFNIATLAREFVDGIQMTDPHHFLLNNRAFV